MIDGLKKRLREMEQWKRKLEENPGRLSHPNSGRKLSFFVKFGTDCPYYHGGKYHGKAMVRPLNKVDEVMEAVKNHVFDNVAVNTRCPDLEDVNVVAIFTNVFLVIDGVFSRLQNSTSILLISNLQPRTTNLIASQMVNFLTLYHLMSLFLPLS
jgi:hypothetical protein